ncbi:hypothetical protein CRI94_07765 [Longibacter salinarum]|uniref:TonB C-terminal domain-containing protein n=1 Tax=Longibacter salinarum TaxID=1850348 RepID=A0A2A8CZB2_9BACT|nr:energy transducer TonB [Longibacter salinarum]PEN13943.1 hypothetical protein CRI94_07765 [Longibacter salinarum]
METAHHRRGASTSVFGVYVIRIQLGLFTALAILLILVNLPGTPSAEKTPWGKDRWGDRVTAHDLGGAVAAMALTPQVTEEASPDSRSLTTDVRNEENTHAGDHPAADPATRPPVRSVATLGPDDLKPKVRGGMQRLYLNITYPRKAIEEGIEGRLILRFVVDTEGNTSNVEVLRSLHALCDSAAVRAVRRTAFVPAQVDGRPVPIRMSLPVRFRLITAARPVDISADENAEKLTANKRRPDDGHP